jgi:hypothetical protein
MFAIFAYATTSIASLKLPAWFGDNMVLQTNAEYGSRSFINGLAKPGEAVTVHVGGRLFPAVADAKTGAWEVEVNHGAGDIAVTTASGETATASSAAGGDVFFCSGQSNMEFPLELTLNASAEAASLVDEKLNFRFFMTALGNSSVPLFDIKPIPSTCDASNRSACAQKCNAQPDTLCNRWVSAKEAAANDNAYLMQFSAVCFLHARELARMHSPMKSRAIGLVQAAWGGTRIEAWMSQEAIAATKIPVVKTKRVDENTASAL